MRDKCRQASEIFHLLSHPARLQILDEVRRDPTCVCHLEAVLEKPQAYVSQQLHVLREAGAVSDRRDGLFVYYRLADSQMEQLLEEIFWGQQEGARSRSSVLARTGMRTEREDVRPITGSRFFRLVRSTYGHLCFRATWNVETRGAENVRVEC